MHFENIFKDTLFNTFYIDLQSNKRKLRIII